MKPVTQTAIRSLERSRLLTGDLKYPFKCCGRKKFQFVSSLVQHLESDSCINDTPEEMEQLLQRLGRGDLETC